MLLASAFIALTLAGEQDDLTHLSEFTCIWQVDKVVKYNSNMKVVYLLVCCI